MKKIYTIVVAVLNVVMFVVIISSALNKGKKPEKTSDTSSSTGAVTSEISAQEDISREPTESISAVEPAEAVTEAPAETQPADTETDAPATALPSADDYSTDAFLEYSDVLDISADDDRNLSWGERSESAVTLTEFSAVTGGWKAYIFANPWDTDNMVAYLMNINISGSEDETLVTLRWNFYSFYSTGETGYMDSPDTIYEGCWQDGSVEAAGEGTVTLEDFWFDNGKEYGLGKINWGDGTYGSIALIRP